MIQIRDLHKQLGTAHVLQGVDFDVAAGEIIALIGPSGTGKSVLLKHIVGLLEPDAGDVLVHGHSVPRANSAQLAQLRRGMGYVFQDAALLDFLTVAENLRLALPDQEYRANRRAAEKRIRSALAMVNLHVDTLRKLPGELSGGMRKRVGVARAIIHEPRVLLYDEPATGLDPRNVAAIDDLILRNRDRFGATSLVVTHDIPSVHRVADRVVLLAEGRVRFIGKPPELLTTEDEYVRNFLFFPRRQHEHL
ncbi:MAG TPA: ATP-binding cassette domain-containing protein [Longimicrobiales bacterium]